MSITKESILDDLENDRLPLPTLPEVAVRVRETVDNADVSIGEVAQIIETDAALSATISGCRFVLPGLPAGVIGDD